MPLIILITELQKLIDIKYIFTENLDILHEKAGSSTIHVKNTHKEEKITGKKVTPCAKEWNIIVCIGLSADQNNWLRECMETNQELTIVTIGPEEVSFPSHYWVKALAEDALPKLVSIALDSSNQLTIQQVKRPQLFGTN